MSGAEAGVVIGGYELVRRIGRGGMAEVWVARKPLGQRGSKFVALKLIADHFVGDERYARMFRAEAELAAVLSHANIVQVFDEGQQDGRSYLVMEWVDGLNLLKLGDVLSLIDDDERRSRVIAYIIGQLLHALDYAHSITSVDGSPLGVVHRDVSPQNVLVSNHGEVKLTDFGVAFHNFEESSGIHVKGKVRYMAPEQIRGESRRATVDLFAVGALLHELLDGRRFRGELEGGQELFGAVLSGHVSPLGRPAPPQLDQLRRALLEPDPARRVPTAKDGLAMLERYPGYGDARGELSKLCGSLTGVLKPRAGPEHPLQLDPEQRRTMQWQAPRPLAKPKVSPPPLPPPPQPPASSMRRGSHRALATTGSRTAVKQSPQARALITGHTQFVSPSTPAANDGPAGQPVANGLGATPQPGMHGWADPQPAASPVRSGGTVVLDPMQYSDAVADHGTEQDLVVATVLGDGSDTSRDPPRASTGTDSVSIVLTKRSAMAALGLGLTMVAALSVATTWLMLIGRRADATLQAEPPVSVSASEDREQSDDGDDGDDGEQGNHEDGTVEAPVDEATPGPTPSPAPQPQATPANQPEEDADRPTVTKPRKPKKAAGRALVKVTSSSGLEGAQLRIGSKVLSVDDRREQEITTGNKGIKWRRSQNEPWQPAKSQRFAANEHFIIYIGKRGPNIRAK